MQATALEVLLLLACIAVIGVSAHAAEHDVGVAAIQGVSITVELQSGEVGAPREIITLATDSGHPASLTLRRITGNSSETDSHRISQKEFQEIWDFVVAKQLRGWLPEEDDIETYDFGEHRLRIAWKTRGVSKPQVHEVAWVRQLKNPELFNRLTKAMARLSRRHLKKLRPLYMQ